MTYAEFPRRDGTPPLHSPAHNLPGFPIPGLPYPDDHDDNKHD